MNDLRKKLDKQNGLSLVELMVVVMLIVIVSAIALMQLGTSKEQFSRQNIAVELKNAFERARFDSVKRRATNIGGNDRRAKVVVDANSISLTTFTINGTSETADTKTTNFAGRNINITSTLTLPYTVYYNQRGEITDVSGNSISPVFFVCNGTCDDSNDTSSNANIVLVTPTGTVNMLSGGSAVPAFSPPPVTSIPANTAIKNDVRIP